MIHKIYLPFSDKTLRKYFNEGENSGNPEKHIRKFKESANNYINKATSSVEINNQIEKDETFWTASTLINIFESSNRDTEIISILNKAFGNKPPISCFKSWNECLPKEHDNLKMYFEANYPSPKDYCEWLSKNISKQTFIPYLYKKAISHKKRKLEGPTNVDCIIINTENGFSIMIEAKVLSDISYGVKYNCQRNQIIRNIDIMREEYSNLHDDLNKKDPNKTLFMLLTPRIFKEEPHHRLYGFKYEEYKKDISSIQRDLPHRNLSSKDLLDISKRIGWVTWEDFKEINNECCKWL